MADMTNYQCPACGGPLHYGAASGKLECEYCGSAYSVAEMEAKYGKTDDKPVGKPVATGVSETGETIEMQMFNCPSCGADLMSDGVTAVRVCPYCGNPQMIPGQMSGEAKPDFIIPFKVDKKAAIVALKAHYKGKKLLPKVFSDENHIEEIQGVYVPFWLYDGEADADVRFEATNSTTTRSGNTETTVTDHYDVHRVGKVTFERIPADASTRMPDAYMDAIEPFNYNEMIEFSQVYMPGYIADKYDVSREENESRIDLRAKQSAALKMEESVTGYDCVTTTEEKIDYKTKAVHYAMLPVWMLSTRWNGQNFLFAVNGQTGKTVGDLPIDKGRYWFYFFVSMIPSALIGWLISRFIFM
ncbi:MAG: hypothetical protein K5641_03450 [Lachnospiraceae bacterium]|nr:hypothetical protein [Lachnospiraceae bacterium]